MISMNVTDAVQHRRSTRAFRNDPVSDTIVRNIIEQARRAPSGGNLQAWHVHIVTGNKYKALVAAAQKQFDTTPEGDPADHYPYPANLKEPYRNRRRAVGRQLYDIVGVARDDRSGKLKYLRRNYEFFDAPVGLFFAIDRQMEPL
ncbi:MAG: nitroreductase family protein, partial [Fimbriimonadaceae bacterium]|nr:nitroreductase family protein [Alphaproteobacteria bacterium]